MCIIVLQFIYNNNLETAIYQIIITKHNKFLLSTHLNFTPMWCSSKVCTSLLVQPFAPREHIKPFLTRLLILTIQEHEHEHQ